MHLMPSVKLPQDQLQRASTRRAAPQPPGAGLEYSAGAEPHLPLPLSPTRATVEPAGTSRLKSLKIGSSGRVG